MTIVDAITLAAALVILARLLTFRRRTARYRPGIALLSWLLVVATTYLAVMGSPSHDAVRWVIAITLVALAIGLIRTGGNVAHLIRPLKRQ
ncbi:phage holin family protein [Vreelandella piezotolerans]|uniref:phage holin family protein n=1 Tax=Vreelandella piezotolerans TaxID=2609667 RepID=UPI00378D6E10